MNFTGVCVDAGTYIDIRHVSNFPSFHDAELIGVEHAPAERVLALRFRRVVGGIEVLRFSEVTGQRLIDFADQNVVSRLLVSPRYIFSPKEVQTWVQWIDSRDDYKAKAISEGQSEDYVGDLRAGRRVLFVLEPSCGAEMAVICGSVALRT